jgi:hypothetical protein
MSCTNGQLANQTTFNNAFVSRTTDTDTTGKVDLENADSASGSNVTNVQREINSLNAFTGRPSGSAHDADPSWTSNETGASTDPLFDRVDGIDAEFNNTTGHAHSGAAGDGAPISATTLTGVLPLANGGSNKALTAVAGAVVYTDANSMEVTAAGTIGQVLTSQGASAPTWTTPSVFASPLTTKGDVFTYSTADARLPVGTNGQVLSADSAETTGLKWVTPASSSSLAIAPIVQVFTASGTYNRTYVFSITEPTTAPTAGATYTNNSVTFTVAKDYVATSGILYARGNNVPLASGTLTKSGGTGDATLTFSAYKAPLHVVAEAWGPGAGGGGALGTASNAAAGSGGGGGEYARKLIYSSALGLTETVTVGTGGAAGADTGGDGGLGSSASSFGSHAIANRGQVGTGDASPGTSGASISVGGLGGTGGTGDLIADGGAGGSAFRISLSGIFSGEGGESPVGGGRSRSNVGSAVGRSGRFPGGGGSGASTNSATDRAGGVGADGLVIATEFYV